MKLFSPDSKFMRAMSLLGDLLVLNLVFLVCCLPIVTIGPAITALDTASFRIVRDTEGRSVKVFFQAFRQNLRRGIALWLVLLLVGAAVAMDIWLFAAFTGALRFLVVLFGILFALVLFTAGYAFPLLSQFDNTVKETLKNALFLSVGYLPRTIAITVLNVFPFALLLKDMLMFLKCGFIWVFLYFAAAACLNAKLLEKVFTPYWEQNKEEKSA